VIGWDFLPSDWSISIQQRHEIVVARIGQPILAKFMFADRHRSTIRVLAASATYMQLVRDAPLV